MRGSKSTNMGVACFFYGISQKWISVFLLILLDNHFGGETPKDPHLKAPNRIQGRHEGQDEQAEVPEVVPPHCADDCG